jgi:Ubiquitin carboxyl-terminal hydrolase
MFLLSSSRTLQKARAFLTKQDPLVLYGIGSAGFLALLISIALFRRRSSHPRRAEKEQIITMESCAMDPNRLESYLVSSRKLVPPGLRNYGVTCFMNSVLQAYASLPKLVEYLLQFKNAEFEGHSVEFLRLFCDLLVGILVSCF